MHAATARPAGACPPPLCPPAGELLGVPPLLAAPLPPLELVAPDVPALGLLPLVPPAPAPSSSTPPSAVAVAVWPPDLPAGESLAFADVPAVPEVSDVPVGA
jgi:hypothetical protein